MDRRVHGVLFTPQYIGGVKSFMSFVRERFNEDEQILARSQPTLLSVAFSVLPASGPQPAHFVTSPTATIQAATV
jgi:hypothetical protein